MPSTTPIWRKFRRRRGGQSNSSAWQCERCLAILRGKRRPWLEDYADDLKKITVPVLVMHGEADQVVPFASSVPRAVDLLKKGLLKTYPGYPHGMLTTHADVLNPDLLSFIRS